MPHDATAGQLGNALDALPTVRAIQVSRLAEKAGNSSGFSWTVLFLDNVGDVSLLEAPAASRNLRAASSASVPSLMIHESVKGSSPSFDQVTKR